MWFLNTDSDIVQLFCTLKCGGGGGVLKDVMLDKSIFGFTSFEHHLPRSLWYVMLPFFEWDKGKTHKFATDISQYTLSTDCFKRQYPEYKGPMEAYELWISGVGRVAGETIQDMLRYKTRSRDVSLFYVLAGSRINDLVCSMVEVFQRTQAHMRETLLCFTLKYCKLTRHTQESVPDVLELVPLSADEKTKEDKNYGYNKSLAEVMMMFILDTARGRAWVQSTHQNKASGDQMLSTKMLKKSWNDLAKERGVVRSTYRPYCFAKKFVKTYFFGSDKSKFIYFID
jgi:hypothetical protein